MVTPTFHMQVDETVRFKMYFLAVQAISVVIVDEDNQTIDFWSIAVDGVTLPKPTRKNRIVPNWGQREEVLLQIPKAGHYRIVSDMQNDKWCFHDCFCQIGDQLHHGFIEVTGGPTDPPAHPITPVDISQIRLLQTAPPDITAEEILGTRAIGYSTIHDRMKGPFPQYDINNKYYTEVGSEFTVKNGTVEEWVITNPDNQDHTFHMHMMHFQVKEIRTSHSVTTDNFRAHLTDSLGSWRDTVGVPPQGQVRVWIRFGPGIGKTVYHCHFLGHEDSGMLRNFIVEP